MQPYHGGTPKINGMNCCEALNALCFKYSSWNEAQGPKQQLETTKQITTLTQPPHLKPYCGGTQKINGIYCCKTLNALSFKWSNWDEAYGPKEQPGTIKQLITLT